MSYESILGLNPKVWRRVDHMNSKEAIEYFIVQKIELMNKGQTCIDVCSGTQPFKANLLNQGIEYSGHDFGQYNPQIQSFFGLHDESYPTIKYDILCDVLDIPESLKYDYILVTEALEHVPDPAEVINKLVKLLKPQGSILISVPGSSYVHQAPYYFSSGLSPFWFEYHASKHGLQVVDGLITGNLKTSVVIATQVLEFTCSNLLFRIFGKIYRLFLSLAVSNKAPDFYYAPILQVCVELKFANK